MIVHERQMICLHALKPMAASPSRRIEMLCDVWPEAIGSTLFLSMTMELAWVSLWSWWKCVQFLIDHNIYIFTAATIAVVSHAQIVNWIKLQWMMFLMAMMMQQHTHMFIWAHAGSHWYSVVALEWSNATEIDNIYLHSMYFARMDRGYVMWCVHWTVTNKWIYQTMIEHIACRANIYIIILSI